MNRVRTLIKPELHLPQNKYTVLMIKPEPPSAPLLDNPPASKEVQLIHSDVHRNTLQKHGNNTTAHCHLRSNQC